MSNWLEKATASFSNKKGEASTEPTPFELRCACGESVMGLRRPLFQNVLCKACSVHHFVLPTDVYPKAKRPVKKKKKKAGKRKAAVKKLPLRLRVKEGVSQAGHRVRQKVSETSRRSKEKVKLVIKRQIAVFTPFRLVILAMIGLVIGTVYWKLQSNSFEQAQQTLVNAQEKGEAALQEQDFLTAADEFAKAAAALIVLNRNDKSAVYIRQMYAESTAGSRLLQMSLVDLLDEANSVLSNGGEKRWQARFDNTYKNNWIVLETAVFKEIGLSGETRTVIDLPLVVHGKRVVFTGSLNVLDRLQLDSDSQSIILAAQLVSCTEESEPDQIWKVELGSETAFLWTNFENYRTLGFEFDEFHTAEQVQEMLGNQARIVGLEQ